MCAGFHRAMRRIRKHLREESTMTEQQRTTGGELKVLTSNSMRGVMVPIAEQFEKTSGYKLAVSYDPAKVMLRRIAAGESADVAILGKPAIDTLTIEGKIDGDSRRTLARCGVGVAVRETGHQLDRCAQAFAACGKVDRVHHRRSQRHVLLGTDRAARHS
jgi:ABC-type molybdate transport system substrate-binding protein